MQPPPIAMIPWRFQIFSGPAAPKVPYIHPSLKRVPEADAAPSRPAALQAPARPLSRTAATRLAAPHAGIPRAATFDPLLAGAALLKAVSDETRKNFIYKSYGDAKWAMYATIDNVMVEGARGVYCAYTGVFIPGTSGHGRDYKERGDQNGDNHVDRDGMNVEHLWPQSYFKEKHPMRADLHHLLPTFIHVNGLRGRLPFGEVPDDEADYRTDAGAKLAKNRLFEPPDAVKGRVARALFYFFARYHDEANILAGDAKEVFWHAILPTLMDWNERFPPDAWERERNDRIETFQGNRNPFVDDPSLASRIGVGNFRVE